MPIFINCCMAEYTGRFIQVISIDEHFWNFHYKFKYNNYILQEKEVEMEQQGRYQDQLVNKQQTAVGSAEE